MLERKGAVVAYVTTKGFRDVTFIQRGNRKSHYDMSWVKPKPLVKRRHCFEVTERIDSYGKVITPLDEAAPALSRAAIRELGEIEAVAIMLLFSYLNPTHEQRLKAIFAEEAPELPVSISYEVLPKWKEYERASTTIADAYLKPVVSQQLRAMRRRLGEVGLGEHLVMIKSNGGEMTLDAAAESPVNMMVSGPTGGVVAGRHVARLLDVQSLVTIDMGGTSTDVSTITGGRESFTTAFEIEWGVPIQIPMIDIRTIGAGGGSIAWIDKGGMLRVGPQSAGASPGPACYGKRRHGADRDRCQSRARPDQPARISSAARWRSTSTRRVRAIEARRASRSATTLEETAMAIVRIANNNMVGALRSVLIERGLDPRDFTLLAFGGAGPLHASRADVEMGIPRAIVPEPPRPVLGLRLHPGRRPRRSPAHHPADPQALRCRARHRGDAGAGRASASPSSRRRATAANMQITRALEMRYLGQNYELELPIGVRRASSRRPSSSSGRRFHEAHKARFGFSIPGEIIEIVNYLATAVSLTPKPELRPIAPADGRAGPGGAARRGLCGRRLEVPIFGASSWRPGI